MPFLKAHLLKVANPTLKSFSIRHDYLPYFYNHYHYHPEVELLYIQEGMGTQFVGDSIQRFKGGDLLFIGSDCPHYLRSDNKYFSGDPNLYVSALVIHFNPSIFGKDFLSLLENRHIDQLLEKSKKGLRILGKTKSEITERMKIMFESDKGNLMLALYALLDLLALSDEYELLGTRIVVGEHNEKETERINAIYKYTARHFKRKISIEEIASVAHLSPKSFCRYFKNKTKKNFSHFLNEIRVEYACKLIRENQLQVTQVCYQAGYNNFANFNNAFKKIAKKTPSQYAKEISNP